MTTPTSNIEAFEMALNLAIDAPSDAQAERATELATQFAMLLTPAEVEVVKREIEQDNP